jgi:sulfonate transport system substrate-binding protein
LKALTSWLPLLVALSVLACGKAAGSGDGSGANTEQGQVLRIGYQKSGPLPLLRWRKTLEPELARRKLSVEWAEFTSGPPLLEALNAEQLDFGFAGEAPPIFAQAASPNLVYIATEPPQPRGEAILVPEGSSLRSVAELRGKRIALNKGSNVHYFLARALRSVGLEYSQVQVVFLPPADARAAFENGTVDAWAIWDPYLAAAEVGTRARVLRNAEGIVQNRQFYLSRRAYAEQNVETLRVLLRELASTDAWILEHREEAAAFLAEQLNIDLSVIRRSMGRAEFRLAEITEQDLASQQEIADTFLQLGLLEKALDVKAARIALAR